MKEEFYKIIKENISEIFESVEVTEESKFIDDLGFDSVSLMQLIIELENHFEIEFFDIDFEQVDTAGKMYEYIERKLDKKGCAD